LDEEEEEEEEGPKLPRSKMHKVDFRTSTPTSTPTSSSSHGSLYRKKSQDLKRKVKENRKKKEDDRLDAIIDLVQVQTDLATKQDERSERFEEAMVERNKSDQKHQVAKIREMRNANQEMALSREMFSKLIEHEINKK